MGGPGSCAGPGEADGQEELAYINEVILQECEGALRCCWTAAKGRVLLASRSFRRGSLVLEQPPLLSGPALPSEGKAAEALQRLCKQRPQELPLEPHWYWLGLASLTEDQRGGPHELPGLPPPVPRDKQRRLLMLHGGRPGDTRSGRLGTQALVDELGLSKLEPLALERLVRAWTLNCFEHSELTRTCATYFVSSFLSHSCQPTAVWVLGDSGNFLLRARCDIAPGEEVTISYLSEDALLEAAPTRQHELRRSKHFWCACPRCLPGAPDLSRGFRCPAAACSDGVICCGVPPRGARQLQLQPRGGKKKGPFKGARRVKRLGTGRLQPAEALAALGGASCKHCGHIPTAMQAWALLRAERRLQARVQQWEQQSPRGQLALEAVERLERQIERRFAQHITADRAYGHLVAVCLGLGCRRDAERLMERRVAFHGAAYPGASGAHAWTMEAYAQMILSNRGMKVGELVRRPRSVAAVRPLLNDVVAGEAAELVMPLFARALEILMLLFGRDHEYYTEVEQTASALQVALETVAPGAAATAAAALNAVRAAT